MSYLKLENGIPDFKKCVISFWFRLPKESMQAAHDNYDDEGEEVTVTYPPVGTEVAGEEDFFTIYPRLNGIIPLLTFGELLDGYYVQRPPKVLVEYPYSFWRWIGSPECRYDPIPPFGGGAQSGTTIYASGQPESGPKFPLDPCVVGLDCNNEDADGLATAYLYIRLQTNDMPDNCQGANYDLTSGSVTSGSQAWNILFLQQGSDPLQPPCTTDDAPVIMNDFQGRGVAVHPKYNPLILDLVYADTGAVTIKGDPERFDFMGRVAVTPDEWHHLIVSFDLSGTISAGGSLQSVPSDPDTGSLSTTCKLWVALDDEDQPNQDPSHYYSNRFGLGPNDLPSFWGTQIAQRTWPATTIIFGPFEQGGPNNSRVLYGEHHHGWTMPKYSHAPKPLKTAGFPTGIPASAGLVNNVYRVEMAEFQMFTDVALDTTKQSNRRVFIDFEKDADGNNTTRMKPVSPTSAPATDDNPDGVALTVKLLGKKPDVLLHGSSNWKTGYNTGTLGITIADDGTITKIPEGQFTPVAGIEKYTPDPSLEKTP